MLYVYIGCLAFGILYSVISSVVGHHGFDHGGMDHSGLDHGTHTGNNGAEIPSPFNPLVIASAITAFGATGIITKAGFEMGDLASSLLSLAFAGIIGTIIFFGVVKLMYDSQSNSNFTREDLIGSEAEISIPVPASGVGEVVFTVNGIRSSFPARSFNGLEISRGNIVIIKEFSGNIALVAKKVTINDLYDMELDQNAAEENKNAHGKTDLKDL